MIHYLNIYRSYKIYIDKSKNEDSSSLVSSNRGTKSLKLPKITIPKFGGSPLAWRGFWDQFSSSIDQNEDLSDIVKFNYLKSLLSGQAEKAVGGLTLSSK